MNEISARPEPESGKAHVLLVEDDEGLGQSIGHVLSRAGFRVSLATDFRAALEILDAECRVDLLLADIVMPASVNGFALARMARLRRRDLKVVYLTGYNIPGMDDEALGPILRKPIDDAVLIAEVQRVLATT